MKTVEMAETAWPATMNPMTPVTIACATCRARMPATRQMTAHTIAASARTPDTMTRGRESIEQRIAPASSTVSARPYFTTVRCGPVGFSGSLSEPPSGAPDPLPDVSVSRGGSMRVLSSTGLGLLTLHSVAYGRKGSGTARAVTVRWIPLDLPGALRDSRLRFRNSHPSSPSTPSRTGVQGCGSSPSAPMSPSAGVLDRARSAGVETCVVAPSDHSAREDWNRALADTVALDTTPTGSSPPVSCGPGKPFVDRFDGRIINTHPALLHRSPVPTVSARAMAHGVKVTGTTFHIVDPGVDTGPIIAQFPVAVQDEDDEESLHNRIRAVERTRLVELLTFLAEGTLTDRGPTRDRVDARTVTAPQNPSTRAGGTRDVQTARPIRRALISVYDKTGLEDLAQGLHAAGVTLVSTGSTAGRITQAGVPVTPVEELTGFPETLEGRVKTLHPRVHAGILADTRKPEHLEQIAELGIEAFDLVVVNLYPFTETVASGASFDDCARADRHRRSVDGPCGGEESPERRRRHRSLRLLRGHRGRRRRRLLPDPSHAARR